MLKILKKEHGNSAKHMCFRLVFVDWAWSTCTWMEFPINLPHRQLMNEDHPHIFGKQYFRSIKLNNFLKFWASNLNLNGFGIVLLPVDAIILKMAKFTLNCMEIQNFDDVMSDPHHKNHFWSIAPSVVDIFLVMIPITWTQTTVCVCLQQAFFRGAKYAIFNKKYLF